MTDRRDDGDPRAGNRPGDPLVVEGGEILQRTAAPRQDNHIDTLGDLEISQCPDDLRRRLRTLDANGGDQDIHGRKAAAGDGEDIADHGPGRRGDDPDSRRQEGKGFLAALVEESLRLETGLELFEGLLEGAQTLRFHGVDDDLVFAAGRIDGKARPADDAHPVLEREARSPATASAERHPEDDRTDLAFRVLQGEIDMARCRPAEVGDLPLHPDEGEPLLEERLDPVVER